ncbi:MAG: sugar phosphate isomerase/epimerase [Betaproteobacteria bacterium]|nr:sugar phosphate isomerase/epimerase [Betaproteobacteria bacterium]
MNGAVRSFACNTYSYTMSHTAGDCLAYLADLGFSEFELMMYPGHLWPPDVDAAQRVALRRLIESRGLRIGTLNMPNVDMNIAGASAQMRRHTLDLLRQIVELAGELGAEGVVIGPGKANPLFPAPRERLEGYFFSALDELIPAARRAGTALWVENMPFAFIPGIEGLMQALDRYGSDELGIVYDVANGHFIGEDLGEALRRCQRRLKLVHLSDTGRSVYRHDAVGMGDVPFRAVPPVLAEIAHVRLPVLEIISQDADADIVSSAGKLSAMGFGRA